MGKKLNKEQGEAVGHGEGPLLIIAGAGTGKTTVVTERIGHLIKSGLAKPSEILALTFTEKAAGEMEERVDQMMPYGYTQMWVMTFHAFCDRVLRDEALQIGLDPRFKLMTEAGAIQLVRNHLYEFELDYFRPVGNPTRYVEGMLRHFARLQDEDIDPKQYLSWAGRQRGQGGEEKLEAQKWKELAKAYRKYEELKVGEGKMDFGDLIVKTLKLFRERPNVLKEYQERFKFVLVDEYQDVNLAQSGLALMLAGKRANITVCGDDDQSIYRFRGAAISNIVQFRKRYPKARLVVLTKNYRSGQEILDKAYELVGHNNPDRLEVVEGIDKRLEAQRRGGSEVRFIHEGRAEDEAEAVAREIGKLAEDYEYRDVAILVRANNHADAFVRALGRKGIPHQFLGPGRLFRQSEVLDLISYLKVLADPDDSVSLYRLLAMEELGIEPRRLVKLVNEAKKSNRSLFEVCLKVEDKEIKRVMELIKKHLGLVRKETAGQLLYWFLEELELLAALLNPRDVGAEKRAANVAKFFDRLKNYETENEDATAIAVVDWIELASELGESPLAATVDWGENDAVNILTVHSSKGLEFPVVFLVNLVERRFPSMERREQVPIPEEMIKEKLPEGDFHTQEERRLFYVGMTRAEERLYLTAADYYGEGKRQAKLSPFIFETLGEEATAVEQRDGGEQLSILDFKRDEVLPARSGKGKREFPVDYLSYSQIDTFRTCPLHYKLKYILKVPEPPSGALSLGTSVHECMKDFYGEVMRGRRGTEKLMLGLLERNWVNAGYVSRGHEKKAKERAREYLVGYLKEGFDRKKLPAAVERSFVVPLSGKQERRLKIGGRFDRVDILSDGGIEIIDYKTGEKVPTQREAERDLQLSIYALAATEIEEELFGKKPEEVKLSFYYFSEQRKITTVRTREQLEEARREIYQVRGEIEQSDFACSGGYLCRNCEFKMFCNVAK